MNEKDDFSLQRTETQAQPRQATLGEREREIEVARTMRRPTKEQPSSKDIEGGGDNKYVETRDKEQHEFTVPILRGERHNQAKQHMFGW